MKSSQFHGSRRNVKLSMQKPLDSILMRDSKVYIPVKAYLKWERRLRGCSPRSKDQLRMRFCPPLPVGPSWGAELGGSQSQAAEFLVRQVGTS